MARKLVRLLAIVATLHLVCSGLSCGADDVTSAGDNRMTEAEARADALSHWEAIRNSLPADDVEYDTPLDPWYQALLASDPHFAEITAQPHRRARLQVYVDQFGQHGPTADLLWMMPLERRSYSCRSRLQPPPRPDREIQMLFAELQVRQFVKNPRLLSRLQAALVWYGSYFDSQFYARYTLLKRYMEAKHPDDDGAYWHYARDFLIMAHATSRNDLFENVPPEELRQPCLKWIHWMELNGVYLRGADKIPVWVLDDDARRQWRGYVPFLRSEELPPLRVKPRTPFPDWDGPVLGDPSEHESMEQFRILPQ